MPQVAGHGRIVAEFFDIGQSRVLPWARRPEAAALVAAMADPDRGFDAIVVGEYERAFYGHQLRLMAPLFEHYGVQLWMPEAEPVDFQAEAHEEMMIRLGTQSKREIIRTRIRVRTAMATQTREQGRYLGAGRPPYGYPLADAGPRPNRAHAAWQAGPTARTRPRKPPRSSGGSSRSGWPATAWPGSPGPSMTQASRARQQPTPAATVTGPGWRGR